MPVNTRLQIRRGTHSEWVVANPVLHYGEMAWESDTGRIKIGLTGDLNWQAIPYSFATLQDPSNAGSLNSFLSESGISLTGVTGVYGHVTGIQIDSKLSPGTDIGLSTDGNGSIVISYTGDASLNFQDREQVETIQDIVGSGNHTSTGFIRQVSGINIVYDDNGSNGSGTLTFALNELVGESGVVTSYNNDSWKIATNLTSGSGIEITDVAGSKRITATGLALESHNHDINDINGFSSVDVTHNSVSGINNLIASGTGIFDVLEINGSNGFVFPNTDGNDDQILVTDGSGVVSWQDQPLNHPVIDNALGNTSNSGRDYVQNISFDQYGHVTGISLGTETVVDHSVTGVVFNSGNNDLVLHKSDGVSITGNLSGVLVSGTSYHSNISNAANDSINNNRNYVQSILLDEYGHITGIIETAQETGVERYYPGTGLSVNTTTQTFHITGVATDLLQGSIQNSQLANSGITVSGGIGLQNGGFAALGETVTLDVDNSVVVTGNTYQYPPWLTGINADIITAGIIAADRLPSYVDDVIETGTFSQLPVAGTGGKIYVTLDTNFIYRWGGSSYVQIKDGDNNYATGLIWDSGAGNLSIQMFGKPDITENLDGRYLQSFTETDPTVSGYIKAITTQQIDNWDLSYSTLESASGNWNISYSWVTGNSGLVVSSGDNISLLMNDSGYATTGELVSTSGHLQTQIDSLPDDNTFISSINYSTTERNLVVTRNDGVLFTGNLNIVMHSGDNVSFLVNDSGYATTGELISTSGHLQTQIDTLPDSDTFVTGIVYNSATHQLVLDRNIGSVTGILDNIIHSGDNVSLLTNDANYIDGSGINNFIPVFSGIDTITNSIIHQSGDRIGIGTSSPTEKLDIRDGDILVGTKLLIGSGIYSQTSPGAYFGLKHTELTDPSEYMIMSDGTHTYLSAKEDSDVIIRGGGNKVDHQIVVTESGITLGKYRPAASSVDAEHDVELVYDDGGCVRIADRGGSGIMLGDCALNANNTYAGIKHTDMMGDDDYMIVSDGTDTYISAKDTGSVYLRPGGNAGEGGIKISDVGAGGVSTVFNDAGANRDIRMAGTGDLNLFRLDADEDRIGIGTHAPAYKLDVSGTFSADSINVNNQYTLPTGDGLTGHSLVTDGAGNIIFSGVSAAGGDGSVNTIYSNGVQVGDDDIEILDFSSNFSVSENPNAKMNIGLSDMITVSGLTISGLDPTGYTFPASDGFNRQVLATDGSGIVYWSGISDIMSGFSDYEIVSSAKSSFIVNGGFTVGSLDVYYNGLKLLNGDDYVEVDGTGFTLSSAATFNDVIEWEGHRTAPEYVTLGNPGNNRLVTSDGSSTTINGQSDLIFDGTGLGLGTTSPSPSGGENSLHIHSNIYPEIKLTNNATNSTSSDGVSILIENNKNFRIINSEESLTEFYNAKANGSLVETLRLGATQSIFNSAGDENLDFLVSGSGSSNLIFADSSTNRVGIGNNSPTTKLDVSGVITASGGDSTEWNTSYSTLVARSGFWNLAYDTVQNKSASWDSSYVWITGNSGNLVYTNQTYENPSWLTSINPNIISGEIPENKIPASFNDVLEYASTGNFPGSAASGIVYIAQDTNKIYRGSGSAYIEISSDTNDFVNAATFNTTDGTLLLTRISSTAVTTNLDGRYTTGSGTANYLAKWTSSKNISSGIIYDDGTNIGIGTASPNYKLDVAGSGSFNSLNINDAFTFPTSDGTEGQSLVSDGAGTVVWSGIDTDTNNYVTGVAFDTATEVLTLNRLDLSDLTTSSFSGVYLKELSQDPSPQLGGDLDLSGNDITGNGSINIGGDLTTNGNNVDIGSTAYGLQVSSSAATLASNRLQILGSETVFNQAGSTADFRVEGTGQSHLLFIDSSKDSVGIATEYPTSKLTIGSGYLDGGGICVDMEGVNQPSFTARRENGDPVFSILSYTSQVYMSVGVYYNGSQWVHSSDNSNSSIFTIDPPNGVLWYSSNSASSISNVANAVNLWDAQGRWNADVIGSVTGPVSGIVAPGGAYTLPSVDGAYKQVMVASGDGTVHWEDQTGTGGGGTSNLIRQSYTPTISTSSFTVTNGYTVGSVNVYKNGVKLFEGSTYDYTATNGSVFNLTPAAASGDLIEVVALNANAAPTANTALASVGVTSTQTQFNTTETITSSNLVVFLNGVKLVDSIDYSVANTSRFDLLSPATSGDTVDYIVYGATVASSNLQKTGDTMTGNLTVGADLIVTGYKETHTDNGNTGTVRTIDITDSTIQTYTLNGNCVFTMPTPDAGRSFTVLLKTGAGSFTGTFTGVKFPGNVAPTITASGNRLDTLTFISDGTNWYGNAVQDYHL
tara:strand:+ start:3566 stop:10504 length:6939 start_codon:yes stop_codon:yes gene_type:complete